MTADENQTHAKAGADISDNVAGKYDDTWWSSAESACQARWSASGLYEAEPDDARPKKFITVAYPYPNSPQHVGHGRTYTLADVHARFWRLRGYNVLFPMGFHYTGTPILGMARRVQEKDPELIRNLDKLYGVSPSDIKSFEDPLAIARYFHDEIKMGMQEMGYSIDWRREFTTIDPGYSKFVEWQITTLRRLNLIIQGSHPVGWCPKDQNPVSQHDTLGDVEPAFTEYVMIKFQVDGYVMPVATLRPETVFGATNLWINPDVSYKIISVSGARGDDKDAAMGQKWIVSAQCAYKLGFLGYDVKEEGVITGSDLVGKLALLSLPSGSPLLHYNDDNDDDVSGIPLLPAGFADPATGTGIVMSVPAHAPYDWQALQDLRTHDYAESKAGAIASGVTAVSVIVTPGYGEIPAKDAVNSAISDCKGQSDPRLEPVTKDLYAKEFYDGIMRQETADAKGFVPAQFAGMPVKEAKDAVGAWLADSGCAAAFLEIADAPVRCRCGSECVVKVLDDQWFLNYGDAKWKESAHRCLDEMRILPDEIRQEFGHVVDWLHERACARQHGLGTRLPWDQNWIVESLSDSVIYMAYYTIARFVNAGVIAPEQMTPEFFDYVMFASGEERPKNNTDDSEHDENNYNVSKWIAQCGIPADTLDEIRREFEYFYPVDYRHSGRDLVPNHLTFFVLNHVAMFAQKKWPLGIVVNGSVLMDGSKMSKSMGNIIPLRKAIREFGADPIRLAIIISAELLQDADFNMDSVRGMRSKLEAMHEACAKLGAETIRDDKNDHNNANDTSNDTSQAHLCNGNRAGDILQCAGAVLCAEDVWLLSKMRRIVASVTESMEKMRLRESLHLVLYEVDSVLQWHAKRTDAKKRSKSDDVSAILRAIMTVRVTLLQPFAPHITESMWTALGYTRHTWDKNMWPIHADNAQHIAGSAAIQSEFLLQSTLDDISSILRVTKIEPSRIVLYVSGDDSPRRAIYDAILESVCAGRTSMKDVMGSLMSGPHSADAKKMPDYIQKAIKDLLSDPVDIRQARLGVLGRDDDDADDDDDDDENSAGTADSGSNAGKTSTAFSEYGFLASELPEIASAMFGARVDVYSEDDADIYDPKSKARHARPFKPAILIE